MAQELEKHLERARRSLERNKLREAAGEYQSALAQAPSNQEVLQALADIYARLNEPANAALYHGLQFDRLMDGGDSSRAAAVFTRFLRGIPQPPDRLVRYASLLQKQNRGAEAIEQYAAAAEQFQNQKRSVEALACYESIAVLDPENPARHAALADLADRLGHPDLAARSYLRAGQLTMAGGGLDQSLTYFGKSHALLPADRTGALLYAEAKLRMGDPEAAVALLEPFSPSDNDTAFLGLFGEALLRAGRLDQARPVVEACYRQKPDSFGKLFDLADAFFKAGQDEKGAALLADAKQWMLAARRETELASQVDRLTAAHPGSLALAEKTARVYEEINRESKLFDALVRLFDLYLAAGRIREACDTLERLVDIDPYDFRNQERIAKLDGRADPAFLQNLTSRAAKAATVSSRTGGFSGAGSDAAEGPASEDVRAQQALEDLMVQVEIFLQYSLQSKAVERLNRIAELFPGEEENNERLRALCDRANWWPKGAPPARAKAIAAPPRPAEIAAPAPAVPAISAADTHRDLAAIAEINRLMYRQSTPREVLAVTAAEIGKHLRVSRCLIAVGPPGEAAQLTAEYSGPGIVAAGAPRIGTLAALLAKFPADPIGAIMVPGSAAPPLAEIGMASALGVLLTDKETQSPAGALLVGDPAPRAWKPSESFFLQAVGDQLMISVNHTKLRSLVRSLAVADEKTGLLGRSAYLDCLLAESTRARAQNSPLSLVLLTLDRGAELLREHGDASLERCIEQLSRSVAPLVRQTDLAVKYTAWSLAFILPGTPVENARSMAEKLRQIAATVRPPWNESKPGPNGAGVSASAIAAQCASRPGDDVEDRVTEWINRTESGLEETQNRGGDALLTLATP